MFVNHQNEMSTLIDAESQTAKVEIIWSDIGRLYVMHSELNANHTF